MTAKSALSIEKTYRAILTSARERRFVTYGDLAAASGVPWGQARLPMNRHLDDFSKRAHQHGCPLLSSIVVTAENRESGIIEGDSLNGLLTAAKLVGFPTTDPLALVKEQQKLVFAWAATAPETLGSG